MKLSRKWIVLAALVLSVAMATTGTVAYLTDTEQAVNVMKVGKVDIELLEQQRNADGTKLVNFQDGNILLPIVGSAQFNATEKNFDKWGMPTAANYLDKIVRVENKGNNDAWMRVYIASPNAFNDLLKDGKADMTDNALHTNLGNRVDVNGTFDVSNPPKWQEEWDWAEVYGDATSVILNVGGVEYSVTEYVYGKLPAGQTTDPLLAGAYLDYRVDWDEDKGQYFYRFADKDVYVDFDASNGVCIPVIAQAVQADGFETAAVAFEAAFGDADAQKAALQTMLEKALGITNVSSQDDLNTALNEGAKTVYIKEDGEYTIPANSEANIIGNGPDTVVKFSGTVKNAKLENVTVASDNGKLGISTKEGDKVTFKNVVFTTDIGWSYAYGDMEFLNCTLDKGFHIDNSSADTEVTFENCIFTENCYIKCGGDATYIFINTEVKELSSSATGPWGKQWLITYANMNFDNCTMGRLVRCGRFCEISFADSKLANGDDVTVENVMYLNTDGTVYSAPFVTIK